jgi:hypothetical protein
MLICTKIAPATPLKFQNLCSLKDLANLKKKAIKYVQIEFAQL